MLFKHNILDALIQPHGIFIDIANAIREEDIHKLETIRNKISYSLPNTPIAATIQKSLLQFIDNLDTSITQVIATDNEELSEAKTEIEELKLQVEEFEKIESHREQRLEQLKSDITDLIENSLL